jgi:modulator of FtsH protease HflK
VDIGFKGTQKTRDSKQAQMLTEDLNIIDITFSVQYFLSDAKAFLFNDRRPDDAVIQSAETAMREVVGKRKMDFLLNQGREEFAAATQKLMQQLLDRYGTGIQISKLNLQTVAAPEAVNEAFQDVVKAQQDRDRFINEGQAYANRVIPEARGRASRLLEEASGYEQSVVVRAQGDASRFASIVGEYNKAPGVTRERLYLDMMQSVLGNTSKVLIDQKQGQSLLYLPLDKLMAGTREAASSVTIGEVTRSAPTESNGVVVDPAATQRAREATTTRSAREARGEGRQ